MPEMKALSRNVREFRSKTGENQIEFAEHCGVSTYTMSAIENIAPDTKVSTVQKIGAYTGMTVSELLDASDNK